MVESLEPQFFCLFCIVGYRSELLRCTVDLYLQIFHYFTTV